MFFVGVAGASFQTLTITNAQQKSALSQYVTVGKDALLDGEVEIFRNGTTNNLIIMLNGTQISELTKSQTDEFLGRFPDLFANAPNTHPGKDKGVIAPRFSSFMNLKSASWEEGLSLSTGYEKVSSGVALDRSMINIQGLKKFGPVWLGGALGYSPYVKGVFAEKIKSYNNGYSSGNNAVTAKIIVAIPWLKIEAQYDGNYLPEYHWLQDNGVVYQGIKDYNGLKLFKDTSGLKSNSFPLTDKQKKDLDNNLLNNTTADDIASLAAYESLMNKRKSQSNGPLVDYVDAGNGFRKKSNLTFSGTLKFGICHASVIYSPSYSMPLFRLYLDNMKLPLGVWGMGVISAKSADGGLLVVPGFWVNIYEINVVRNGAVTWSPAKIYFHQMNKNTLLGINSEFHLKLSH